MSTITERVAEGAAYLDRCEPGWDAKVDLGKLDMQAPCLCVLGQLATDLTEHWGDICAHFGIVPHDTVPAQSDWALGFNAYGDWNADIDDEPDYEAQLTQQAEYAELTAEWKRVIVARRQAVLASA